MTHPTRDAEQAARDREIVNRGFWPKFRRVAASLPFAEDLLTAYYAATDAATPWHVQATLLGALAYFVMPADLVPDFILGLGFTDDAAVLAVALKSLTGQVRPGHRERARRTLIDTLVATEDDRDLRSMG